MAEADGKVIIDTELDTSGVDKGVNQLNKKMDNVGNNMQKTADKMGNSGESMGSRLVSAGGKMQAVGGAMAKTFGGAGLAVAGGLGIAVKKSMDFGAEMSRVGAISGASGKQFGQLKAAALDLGASTSLSASQVAQGMENMAALGFTTNDILKAMPGVISAAEASGTDLATTADIVAAAINGFGLSAKDAGHVSDVMAETANRSAASVQDLGYAFKYAAPVAKGMGVSMEDLAAATGIMTNAGLSGEQAGTTLRASLLSLANPTDKAAAALEDLGVKTKDSQGNFVGFPSLIAQFQKGMKGMTDTQKTAALAQIFGTESASGMLTMIGKGPAAFNKFSTGLQNADGASAKAAKTMKDNLQGSLQELGGAFETAAIKIGDALTPAIQTVAGWITNLGNAFNGLSPEMQNAIAITAAIVAGVLLLIGVIGSVLIFIGSVVSAIGTLLPILGAIGSALGVLISWPALIIAAVVVLVVLVIKYWTQIKDAATAIFSAVGSFLANCWNGISTGAQAAWGAISGFFSTCWIGIKTTAQTIWNAISGFFSTIWNGISSTASAIWNPIASFFMSVWTPISNAFTSIWNNTKGALSTVWGAIKTIAANVWTIIKNVILGPIVILIDALTGDFDGLKSHLTQIWDNIKGAASAIWGAIKTIVMTLVTTAVNNAKAVWSGLTGALTAIWNGIKAIGQAIWGGIVAYFKWAGDTEKAILTGAWNAIKSAASAIWGAIVSTVKAIFNGLISGVKSIANGIGNGLKSAWNGIKSATSAAWKAVVGFIKNPLEAINLLTIGKNIIMGLVNGIKNSAGAVGDVIKGIGGSIKSGFMKVLGIHSPSRWMEDVIGKNLMLGGQIGMEDEQRSTEKTAEKAATFFMPAAPSPESLVPRPAVAAAAAGGAPVTNTPAPTSGPADGDDGGVTVHVAQLVVREEADVEKISRKLYNLQQKARKGRGK